MKNISQSAIGNIALEFTKDPEWCVRNLFPTATLPTKQEFDDAVSRTWEHKVVIEVSKRIGAPYIPDRDSTYWTNVVNVCEDAKAGHIPKPTDSSAFLAAMVDDYRANVQGGIQGPYSAGKTFVEMDVAAAAQQLLRHTFGSSE